ncbi:hypothetical protein [Nocardioides sp.]|uniref:hypothetical protein n=1 Tax=Nocardioides sp. TaxID=35761 RepID=UPI002ED5D207
MRPTARLGGLVSAVVLGTMLVSPPSYAAKSLTVSCTAESGLVSYPSGTATVTVVVTFDSGPPTEASAPVSRRREGNVTIGNDTERAFVGIDATALSQVGKVLASGSAAC